MTTQDANGSGAPSPVHGSEMAHAPAPHGSVLDGAEFIDDLLLEMARASKRIYVKAFFYRKGPLVDKVTAMLAMRAQDGIDTRLNVDYYARLKTIVEEPDTSVFDAHMELKHRFYEAAIKIPVLPEALKRRLAILQTAYTEFKERAAERDGLFEFLAAQGVRLTFSNEPHGWLPYLPFCERNHIKLIVVDDVAYLGGPNFDDAVLNAVDFMMKIANRSVVDWLGSLFQEMEHHQLRNGIYPIDGENTLVLDDGTSHRSACYDYACWLVEAAHDVSLISGYLPAGRLRKALNHALTRGSRVRLIYTNPPKQDQPRAVYNAAHKLLDRYVWRGSDLGRLDHTERVHAKLLLADDRLAYTGSHNFSLIGNYVHAAEICLATSDTSLVGNLREYYLKQYAACHREGPATQSALAVR
jgi:phosphatidylserine/phosphatidylglycerophosphate/cardiolipin synthase-like enzyme